MFWVKLSCDFYSLNLIYFFYNIFFHSQNAGTRPEMKDAIFGQNLDDASEALTKACLCNASAAVDTAVSMIKKCSP